MAYLLAGLAIGLALLFLFRALRPKTGESREDVQAGGAFGDTPSDAPGARVVDADVEPAPYLSPLQPAKAVGPGWRQATESAASNDLNGIWGFDASHVIVVGGKGTILRFDGRALKRMESPTRQGLNGVWGPSPSDLVAVGNRGTILRFDGEQWTVMKSGTRKRLRAVYGFGDNDVYAVGDVVLHFDGNAWTPIDVGVEAPFTSVWGSSPNDVYVVASDGTIAHFDGSAWTHENPGFSGLSHVRGTAPDDVVVVGGDIGEGVVLEGSCGDWHAEELEEWPVAVWPFQSSNVHAVDWSGGLLHSDGRDQDGSSWRLVHEHGGGELTAIWGAAEDAVFAAGLGGSFLRFDGERWESLNPSAELRFKNVRVADGGAVHVAEWHGIYRLAGTRWERLLQTADSDGIEGLWVSADGEVFVVGAFSGRGFALRWDGERWRRWEFPAPLASVAGTSASDVWATCAAGLQHFDGERWHFVRTGHHARKMCADDEGNVWAVDDRRVLFARGCDWRVHEPRLGRTLYDVWARTPHDVYAVGADGSIAHYDGTAWSQMDSGTDKDLYSVWGVGEREVYAGGSGGIALRYDGVSWTPIESGADTAFFGIGGREPGGAWFVGGGEILHWRVPG